MPRKPNPPPDDAEQAARFMETARTLQVEQSGALFETAIGKVIEPNKTKPADKQRKKLIIKN
jgi:hypothetical protein